MLLCCTHVIGYSETTTIHDDVVIMSATGTAAAVRDPHPRRPRRNRRASLAAQFLQNGSQHRQHNPQYERALGSGDPFAHRSSSSSSSSRLLGCHRHRHHRRGTGFRALAADEEALMRLRRATLSALAAAAVQLMAAAVIQVLVVRASISWDRASTETKATRTLQGIERSGDRRTHR
ncbi:unnamed protein product [Scytosiphon promiscuus]